MYTEKMSEEIAVLAAIDPASVNNTSVNTAWVPVGNYRRLLGIVQAGVIDTTLDALIQYASDNAGTGAATLAGTAITQYAATDDSKQVLINARVEAIPQGFPFVRLRITVGNATASLVAGLLLGAVSRFPPVTDATTVKEIVG